MKLTCCRTLGWFSGFLGLGMVGILSTASFGASNVKVGFCNESEQKLFLAVAYEPEMGEPLIARGWWSIDPNKCSQVDLPIAGDRILLYANSENQILEWRGDTKLCVDSTNKFDFASAQSMPCVGETLGHRNFKELSLRQLAESTGSTMPAYTFRADGATRLADALKLCNDSGDTLYLSYAQRSSQAVALALAGWFKVLPGKCHETLKSQGSDELFLYASNERGDKRWKGDIPLCTNSYDGFLFTEAASMECHGNNERRQLFKKISMNPSGDFEYRLKSIGSETSRSMVELCNKGSANIVVAIASENLDFRGQFISTGWFGVKVGECSNALPVDSEILHVYVENSDGEVLRSGDFAACIHKTKAFEFGDANSMRCDAENEERRLFDQIKIEPGNVKLELP